MKQLFALAVLLLVVGVASFLYRNTVERPGAMVPEVACTLEAKVCPDGTSVGREGPSCAFAPCALPNVEIANAGISFALPAGYAADEDAASPDDHLIATFTKPSSLDWPPHAISIYRYPIPEGETAEDVILAHTRYQPADEQATDLSRFEDIAAGDITFKETTIERFEGLVRSSYFLVRATDVLRFDIVEKGVQGWTDAALVIRQLPEHLALFQLLRTLQVAP